MLFYSHVLISNKKSDYVCKYGWIVMRLPLYSATVQSYSREHSTGRPHSDSLLILSDSSQIILHFDETGEM